MSLSISAVTITAHDSNAMTVKINQSKDRKLWFGLMEKVKKLLGVQIRIAFSLDKYKKELERCAMRFTCRDENTSPKG